MPYKEWNEARISNFCGIIPIKIFGYLKTDKISGLYYKHVTIVIYDHNDSVQYHKTRITIVIDDP